MTNDATIHFVGRTKVRVFSAEDVQQAIEASPSGWCSFKLDPGGKRDVRVRVDSVAYVEPNNYDRASWP